MSVTLSAKTVPITSSRSKTDDVRARQTSTSAVPVDTGPLGELAVTRGAEEITEIYTEEARPSASAEASGLTRANLRRLKGIYPVAAPLASVLSSMPPSKTTPTPGIKVANAKVKAWRRATRKRKGEGCAFENDVRSYVGRGDVRDTSRQNGLTVVDPIIRFGA